MKKEVGTGMKRTLTIALCMVMGITLMLGHISPAAMAAELPQAGLNYDQYPALREMYKDYFLVGTTDRFGDPVRTAFMNYTYNAVTHENNLKPASVQNTKGTFTFDSANTTIKNAKAGITDVKMIGHTLTWHSQSPNWLWDAPTLDRATALDNLNNHIDNVLGEFGGQLYSIDVVNEPVGSPDPNDPTNWKAALEKGEGWVLSLGWEWVELAFLRAAKVVDENGWDCKLYLNDFGLNSEEKARIIYEMVKDINERYAGHRPNGKALIEGVGFQEHYNSSTKVQEVEASVALIGSLPGVSISFTELDIEYLNTGSLTPEQSISQAQQYAQLFQIFRKYAAGPANTTDNPKVIERVTLWGTDDGGSWKGSSFPLLFNAPNDKEQITAKESLLAALWADEYLEKYPREEDDSEASEIYVPGVYVFGISKGDIWSGANIILGNDASQWPWSAADPEDPSVAFVPEKDETYRLSVNYTALGTAGIRVRWISDNTNGSYTAQDAQVVGEDPYKQHISSNAVAKTVPALFNGGMVNSGTYTLVTEFTMDGSQAADGLIGNLAIRGYQGGNAFDINWLKIEKMDGEQLVLWDPNNPPEPTAPPATETPATETPSVTAAPSSAAPQNTGDTADDSGSGGGNNTALIIGIIAGVLVIAAVAVILLRRKRK